MDTKRLECFVTLAEHLNFSRAAEQMFLSQSSFSYHIAELEKELGTPLFVRSNKFVSLTAAGAAVLPIARSILSSAQSLIDTARSASDSDGAAGIKLTVGLDNACDELVLLDIPSCISALKNQLPGTQVSLLHRTYKDLLLSLESGICDIIFVAHTPGEIVSPNANTIFLLQSRFVLVYYNDGNEYDIQAVLNRFPLLLNKTEDRWAAYISNLLSELNLASKKEYLPEYRTILNRLLMGEGVIIIPQSQFESELSGYPGLSCLNIDSRLALCNVCAMWMKDNLNPLIQELIQKLRDFAPDA